MADDLMPQVAMFADRGFTFSVDESEDISSVIGHLKVLTKSGHAMTRILNSLDSTDDIDAEELTMRVAEAREGVEFILSMCANLAEAARWMERGEVQDA